MVRTTLPPMPAPENLLDAVIALAAAARQSTMDDEGTAFVTEHLLRTTKAVLELEARAAKFEQEVLRLNKLLTYDLLSEDQRDVLSSKVSDTYDRVNMTDVILPDSIADAMVKEIVEALCVMS
jgi:hypothetical protein